MRKILKLLALTACTAALCGTLAGCKVDEAVGTDENPIQMVYVYSPDGTLLDKGVCEESRWAWNWPVVSVKVNGKKYTTGWANVVLTEE